MPGSGRVWTRERDKFKAECKRTNAQCWLCKNTKGPIDYESKFDPKRYNPLMFSLDEEIPSSLGGNPLRTSKWRASHLVCNVSRGNTTRGQFPTSRQW